MRIVTASLLVASLALVGALPAAAGQSATTLGTGASLRLLAAGDSTEDHDAYTRKAHSDVEDWQQKIDRFAKKTEAAGKDTGKAAASDLNIAWSKTEAASHRLETAGADGWEGAKTAFEKASGNLSDAWHRNVPDDK